MLFAGGAQIAEELGDVLVRKASHRFQLQNEEVIDQNIGEVLSQSSSVLVEDIDRMLGRYDKPPFLQSMHETIMVNLFEMPMTKVAM
jgi:hypothetical protein